MKTLVFSTHEFDKPFLKAEAEGLHHLDFTSEMLSPKTVGLAKGFEAVAVFSSDNVNSVVLNNLSQYGVKYITCRSVGFDNVDLKKAAELNIKVANVPEYSPYAIAEHGAAMLLMLNRKLYQAQTLIKQHDFRLDTLVGFDFHGKTVGIIGLGKIGIAFGRIMKGFGCKLIGYDLEEKSEAKAIGVEFTNLEVLLKNCDIVSLNCPLNEGTSKLIGKKQLQLMKKSAILLNTSRGGVVDTQALIISLQNQDIFGACLDVYENEKGLFFFDHSATPIKDELYLKLSSLNNVLITGHQAFLTKEALQGIANTTIANLSAWETNGISVNEVN